MRTTVIMIMLCWYCSSQSLWLDLDQRPDTPEWLHLRQAARAVVVALAYVKLDNVTGLSYSALTSLRHNNTELSHNLVDYLKHLTNFTLC